MVSTGNRIQSRREFLKLSREDLAKRLGTTRLKVWRIETGKIKVDADTLPGIAVALETTVADLVPHAVEPSEVSSPGETSGSAA